MRFGASEKPPTGKGASFLRGPCLALALAVDAVCVLIWMEAIARNSFKEALVFLFERTLYVMCSLPLIFCLLLALAFLLGRVAPALSIGNAFFLILGVVERFKLELRDEPFLPTDLAVAGEGVEAAMDMIGSGLRITPPMVWGAALMVAVIPLSFTGIRILRKKLRIRLICALLSCAMLAGSVVFVGCSRVVMDPRNLCLIVDDYAYRGMLIAFLSRLPGFGGEAVERPETYGPEAVEAILGAHLPAGQEPRVKPDIFFIMSESLYDATDMLSLSEDPLTYTKQIQRQYGGGSALVPMYGGGTAHVEYEVLTGYRIQDTQGAGFTGTGGVVQEGMDSIASVLKDYGYHTLAIHPNEGAFYARKSAYEKLGFDESLFEDELPPAHEEILPHPSDEYLFEQMIRAYERRPRGQPWFCHAVTYQNHTPYDFAGEFSLVRVEEELAPKELRSAQNYASMLKLSDDQLRRLIAYFDAQENPTVIVVWGDHAPSSQLFGKKTPEAQMERIRYYETPLIIYNNFGLDMSALPERVSSYRLGAWVLRLLGMDSDAYFNYLAADDTPNLTLMNGLIEQNGAYVTDQARYNAEAERLRLLHYDRLFGEHYGEGESN